MASAFETISRDVTCKFCNVVTQITWESFTVSSLNVVLNVTLKLPFPGLLGTAGFCNVVAQITWESFTVSSLNVVLNVTLKLPLNGLLGLVGAR